MQDVVMNGEWVKDFLGNYLGPNDSHYAFRFTTLSQLWGVRYLCVEIAEEFEE